MSEVAAAAPAAPVAAPAAEVQQALDTATTSSESTTPISSEASEGTEVASKELKTEAKAAVKDAVASMKRKFNIKVDGKQLDKEIDLGNEAEVIKILQMAEMAQARAQEAAELRKTDLQKSQEMEQFLQALKNDPRAVLEYLGHDVPGLADKILNDEIIKMQMTPEEKEKAELKERVQKLEEEKRQLAKSKEEQDNNAMKAKYAAEYEKDLITALDSAKLPRNGEVVTRLTGMMKTALKNKIDISFSDLIPLVREEMDKDLKALIASMPAEQLELILGEEVVKGIVGRRRKASEAAKAKTVPPVAQQIKDAAVAKTVEVAPQTKRVSAKDFFKRIGK